jgi:TolA-binding protein
VRDFPQDPLAGKAYLGMEEGYRSQGKMREAENVLKECVEKFPKDGIRFESHLRLARLYLMQKRFKEAISALSIAVKSPDEGIASEAQFKLGEAYLGAGDREQALLQFSRVTYLYPQRTDIHEEALLKLGTLYMDQGKTGEARKIYQKLLESTKREDRRDMARRMISQIDKGTNQ